MRSLVRVTLHASSCRYGLACVVWEGEGGCVGGPRFFLHHRVVTLRGPSMGGSCLLVSGGGGGGGGGTPGAPPMYCAQAMCFAFAYVLFL